MIVLAYLWRQCTKFCAAGWTCWFLHPFIWSCVSDLMRFLTADQMLQHVNICKKLYLTFLTRVITCDKSWIYSYDPETKQQSSQWKSPNSPRLKKAWQVKSKHKSMLIIFFDIKAIVHKEFILVGQTVNSVYYYDVLWQLTAWKCAKACPELWW
jgi:histone-lysine N-methyltransferase SETMAR